MVSKELIVHNQTGLHARPASEFTRCAARFKSVITVTKNGGKAVNAKSMIMVLSQSIVKDTVITIAADGEDEVEALETLTALVESFSE